MKKEKDKEDKIKFDRGNAIQTLNLMRSSRDIDRGSASKEGKEIGHRLVKEQTQRQKEDKKIRDLQEKINNTGFRSKIEKGISNVARAFTKGKILKKPQVHIQGINQKNIINSFGYRGVKEGSKQFQDEWSKESW